MRIDKLVVSTKIKNFVVKFAYYLVLCSLSFVFIYPFLKMVVTSLMADADLVNITVNWVPTKIVAACFKICPRG